MPKRARSESLTGGTGDVNPQWMNLFSANNPGTSYTEGTFSIPIQRLPDDGRAQVLEVLKVEWGMGAQTNTLVSGAASGFFSAYLTTRSFTGEPTGAQSNGQVISKWQLYTNVATAASASFSPHLPYVEDVTDGAGHGLLVATDNIFLGFIQSEASVPIAGTFTCRILYRWKNVRLAEYIGIVQSQQ